MGRNSDNSCTKKELKYFEITVVLTDFGLLLIKKLGLVYTPYLCTPAESTSGVS